MTTVYAAGGNANYDLGLGDATQRNSHTAIAGDWLVIKSSSESYAKWALGIKTDGTLWGVGDNGQKQLGGLPNASYNTWTQIGTDTDWVDIALGAWHMIALKSSGVAWAVGSNSLGQCGVGNNSVCNTLTLVAGSHLFKSVHASQGRSAGIRTDDTLRTWGENGTFGLCGVGTTTASYNTPQSVTLATTIAKLSLGRNFAYAILTDGRMYSWGSGGGGALGNGSTSNRTSPYQVGSATDWASVAAGYTHACAIKSDGTAWSTGDGTYYATAQGSTAQINSMTQIGSATDWAEVGAWFFCTMLRKTSGSIWVVGYNATGVLGTNGTSNVTALGDLEATYGRSFPDGARSISTFNGASFIAFTPLPAYLSAPIEITVEYPTGVLSAPIEIKTHGSGSISAPLRISVVDSLETRLWKTAVTLDGVDVSSQLVGRQSVDAGEGAARIAAFTLSPPSGAVDPVAWTGRSVTVDLVRIIAGASVPVRIFTGVVDVATFDPTHKTLAFLCTDDRQNRVAALPKDEIDLLTQGRYSEAVYGVLDEHWQYAEARMATRTASLDVGPMGQLRTTEWDGLPIWKTFTTDDLDDESFSIDMPRRSEIVNRIDISYEYRYYRCRERHAWIAWSKSVLGSEGPASGYQYPSQGEIASALSGCGWHRISEVYGPSPAKAFVGSPSGYWVDTAGGVASLAAHLSQRHAQPVTEKYTISVSAPASIASNGLLAKPLRGALESEWNPDEWENDYAVNVPDASSGEVNYAGTRTRAESDEAIRTLMDMARTQILDSHRNTRPRFRLPCLPEADVCLAVAIDTPTITASGKIVRVEHEMDSDAGRAHTYITLALFGVAAGGIVVPDDLEPPDPPEPDVGSDPWTARIPNLQTHIGYVTDYAYTEDTQGYLVAAPATYSITNGTDVQGVDNSYYDPDPEFVQVAQGFRIQMPGVLDNYRNPATAEHAADYVIEIPVDAITINV